MGSSVQAAELIVPAPLANRRCMAERFAKELRIFNLALEHENDVYETGVGKVDPISWTELGHY